MVNDKLDVICNALVVHADLSASGALDERCLELAKLAAMDVDFHKTGEKQYLYHGSYCLWEDIACNFRKNKNK